MEVRRRHALLDPMAISNPTNLRDLLKLREEGERRETETLTLGAILGGSTKLDVAAASRSLLDIIRDEDIGSSGSSSSCGLNATATSDATAATAAKGHRIMSWRCLRDRLLCRSSASATSWNSGHFVDSASAIVAEADEAPTPGNSVEIEPAEAERTDLAAALAAEREQQLQRRDASIESPARIPLIALLEEDTFSLPFATEEEEEYKDDRDDEDERGKENMEVLSKGESLCCCVCMVRKKGAAFIPCGHTFCRACTRELWIIRGCCPLCNASIQEVLDIF